MSKKKEMMAKAEALQKEMSNGVEEVQRIQKGLSPIPPSPIPITHTHTHILASCHYCCTAKHTTSLPHHTHTPYHHHPLL
jgi:hypothetical protein